MDVGALVRRQEVAVLHVGGLEDGSQIFHCPVCSIRAFATSSTAWTPGTAEYSPPQILSIFVISKESTQS